MRTTQNRKALIATLLLGVSLSAYSEGPPPNSSVAAFHLHSSAEAHPTSSRQIPHNFARWYMGASLILVENGQFQHIDIPQVGDYDESIFLSDNSALIYKIAKGPHNYIIDFGEVIPASRFFLNNQSAAGSVELLSSNTLADINSPAWLKLSKVITFEKDVIPSITFPTVETRFILIRLNIDTAGTIGNFGVTGPQANDFITL